MSVDSGDERLVVAISVPTPYKRPPTFFSTRGHRTYPSSYFGVEQRHRLPEPGRLTRLLSGVDASLCDEAIYVRVSALVQLGYRSADCRLDMALT